MQNDCMIQFLTEIIENCINHFVKSVTSTIGLGNFSFQTIVQLKRFRVYS